MNRLTNAAKYAAIIMSLIVTVTMVSGCKRIILMFHRN